MAIKKSDDIENEGSDFNTQKSAAKLEIITERFDDSTHNDNPYDDAIQYLKKKVDEIVDETNIQTVASGSYAGDIKILKTASGSFSTRVTANDAKTPLTIGTRSTNAKAGDTTTISTAQAALLKNLGKGITNLTGAGITFALNDETGALVITIDRSTYTISADR